MEDRSDTSDQGLLAAFGADEPLPEDAAESADQNCIARINR
jgi:hypothetical protein